MIDAIEISSFSEVPESRKKYLDYDSVCAKCGEQFQPDSYDVRDHLYQGMGLIHFQREDGIDCDGLGTVIGAWDRGKLTHYRLV